MLTRAWGHRVAAREREQSRPGSHVLPIYPDGGAKGIQAQNARLDALASAVSALTGEHDCTRAPDRRCGFPCDALRCSLLSLGVHWMKISDAMTDWRAGAAGAALLVVMLPTSRRRYPHRCGGCWCGGWRPPGAGRGTSGRAMRLAQRRATLPWERWRPACLRILQPACLRILQKVRIRSPLRQPAARSVSNRHGCVVAGDGTLGADRQSHSLDSVRSVRSGRLCVALFDCWPRCGGSSASGGGPDLSARSDTSLGG